MVKVQFIKHRNENRNNQKITLLENETIDENKKKLSENDYR